MACILWAGAKNQLGYGLRVVDGRMRLVHRLAYCSAHNIDINDLVGCVRHKCDVRNCINPDHLELGTHTDNMRDKFKSGKSMRKLTNEVVIKIRAEYVKGSKEYGGAALGRKYGLAPSTITRIINGVFCSHVS